MPEIETRRAFAFSGPNLVRFLRASRPNGLSPSTGGLFSLGPLAAWPTPPACLFFFLMLAYPLAWNTAHPETTPATLPWVYSCMSTSAPAPTRVTPVHAQSFSSQPGYSAVTFNWSARLRPATSAIARTAHN